MATLTSSNRSSNSKKSKRPLTIASSSPNKPFPFQPGDLIFVKCPVILTEIDFSTRIPKQPPSIDADTLHFNSLLGIEEDRSDYVVTTVWDHNTLTQFGGIPISELRDNYDPITLIEAEPIIPPRAFTNDKTTLLGYKLTLMYRNKMWSASCWNENPEEIFCSYQYIADILVEHENQQEQEEKKDHLPSLTDNNKYSSTKKKRIS